VRAYGNVGLGNRTTVDKKAAAAELDFLSGLADDALEIRLGVLAPDQDDLPALKDLAFPDP
jgi:hypothetical protein